MKFSKDEEAIKKVKELLGNGKSFRQISEEVGYNRNTIYNYVFLHNPELIKSKKNNALYPKNNQASSLGFHSDKLIPLTECLLKNLERYKTLIIIGYQNCRGITDFMKKYNKTVVAIDIGKLSNDGTNSEFVNFYHKNPEHSFTYDVNHPSFKTVFEGIVKKYGKCAVYVNLTGDWSVIELVHKYGHSPIIAIVSPRTSQGKEKSSLEKCKGIGAEITPIYKNGETNGLIAVACIDKSSVPGEVSLPIEVEPLEVSHRKAFTAEEDYTILELVAQKVTIREIAEKLHRSLNSVKTHYYKDLRNKGEEANHDWVLAA